MEIGEKDAARGKREPEKGSKPGGQGQYRVIISQEANQELEWMVAKIVEGSDSIAICKSDVAEYVFKNLASFLGVSDFKAMRSLYFDEKKVLGSILKRANIGGDLPDEIKKALREHCGLADSEKKRRVSSAA